MADRTESRTRGDEFEPAEQPAVLVDLLKNLDVAGRSLALYGTEHSIAKEHLTALNSAIARFAADTRRATCIFGKDCLIVNDASYLPSDASQELAKKLRARGVMAITFAGEPSEQEIVEFVSFLNARPIEIRMDGGPSDYLRKRGVSRIVATEAVYVSEDEDDASSVSPRSAAEPTDVDRAIAYAIDWLSKQEEDDGAPRLPITEILSRPDKAARLIREAVSKLHASRRDYTDRELVTEVINDLKDLADSDPAGWDDAVPQIRKAIAKLPRDMLPAASGFTDPAENTGTAATAPIDEIEAQISSILQDPSHPANLPAPESFKDLFGARAEGLLSGWRHELQPDLVIRSSGRTLSTLMAWESNAAEYSRIASALAQLIPRAMAVNDIDSALEFAESLLVECKRDDDLGWRSAAARSAFQNLEPGVLTTLVETAMKSGSPRALEVCAGLVATVRGLAAELLPMLEVHDGTPFGQALRKGIRESRQASMGPLREMLRTGSPSGRIAALELIAEISGPTAVEEVGLIVSGPDEFLAVRALAVLARVRIPAAVQVCAKALNHASIEVRQAAIETLGAINLDESYEILNDIAARRSLTGGDINEKLAVVKALEGSDRPEALKCLEAIARRAPLLGRGRYDEVRNRARRAADAVRNRLAGADLRAA